MENNESTQSKYDAALAKYNTNLNDAEVAAEVAGIIAEKVPANNTPEVKKFLFNCIDLTTLNSLYSLSRQTAGPRSTVRTAMKAS